MEVVDGRPVPDRSFDMEFLGGVVGVAEDQETLALRPEVGWAVREAPTNG
jgi:hypothetical protein